MIKAIYVITNKINGKQYVGQTVHPEKRWWEHKNRAKTKYDLLPIHLAISKYGEDNFSFEILEWTYDYDAKEIETISKLKTLTPNGYNIARGGNTNVMYGEDHPRNTVDDETVNNIIIDLKEAKLSDRSIAKKYNTTDKIIADINHGYSHKKDNETYPIRNKKGMQKLTIEQVNDIVFQLINTNATYQKLADQYEVSKGVIYHINKGLTFHNNNLEYPLRGNKRNEQTNCSN